MAPRSEILAEVLRYAALGWRVFPCHATAGGRCTCGQLSCGSPAKHPRTRHGLSDAATDPSIVSSWWRRWPTANPAVATGAGSGVVVIDVDPRHGGDASLASLVEKRGGLPPTIEAETGGGGRHFFFVHPGAHLGNRTGGRSGMPVGLDFRGDGGYVLVAPSWHISGGFYRWAVGASPHEIRPAPLPAWLHALVAGDSFPRRDAPRPLAMGVDDVDRLLVAASRYATAARGVAQGGRNAAAFSLAGHLAAFVTESGWRLTESQIVDILRAWNLRNTPPLSEAELGQVVASAAGHGAPRQPHVVGRRTRRAPDAGSGFRSAAIARAHQEAVTHRVSQVRRRRR